MWQIETRPPEDPCCALLEALAIKIRGLLDSPCCHAVKEASTWLLAAQLACDTRIADTVRVAYRIRRIWRLNGVSKNHDEMAD